MEKYDYYEAVKEDVKNYLKENFSNDELKEHLLDNQEREDFESRLQDILWTEDSVTGNGSGSYTFNSYEAEENLCHNWNLLTETLDSYDEPYSSVLEKGPEWCDVSIRCYLLGQAISEVLDELTEDFE